VGEARLLGAYTGYLSPSYNIIITEISKKVKYLILMICYFFHTTQVLENIGVYCIQSVGKKRGASPPREIKPYYSAFSSSHPRSG